MIIKTAQVIKKPRLQISTSQLRKLASVGSSNNTVDVAIVGGGPAGLSLAAGLVTSDNAKGLKIKVIEASSLEQVRSFASVTPEKLSNRVSSLTASSVAYLKKISAWEHVITSRVSSFDKIIAYDGLADGRVELDGCDMGYICENVNLQSGLLTVVEAAGAKGAVEVQDKTKVTKITRTEQNWPLIELDNGRNVTARLVVGCDGFNSPVRKFGGIESRGWSYDRFGVVATVKQKFSDFRSIAWQRFLPSGPLALMPLPNKTCSLVWSTTPELSQLFLKIPEPVFVKLLNAAIVLPQVDLDYYYKLLQASQFTEFEDDLQWRITKYTENLDLEMYPVELESVVEGSRARFPLKMSHADTYVGDRIALVGDAAHTTHPLAGQGLNMGQADVQSLVKALEIALHRGLDIGSPLALEPYWAERYPQNHVMLGTTDKLHKLFSIDWSPVVAARSLGMDVVNQLGFVKEMLVGYVSGK